MPSGSNKLFDDLAAGGTTRTRSRKRSAGYLDQRENALTELAAGAIEDKTLHWIDPARCKMWDHHNRRYDLLSEDRCRDLIDGFIAQGRQEFPAIVRKLDGQDHDYEVICGARRHWTVSWLRANNYPDFNFLIEIRDLTDEQAFRLSDIENRDREDISDYERAVDYKNALALYYRNQKDMAKRLEVSEAWLSRYLALADVPDEIVAAYADIADLRARHVRDLKPHLKSAKGRAAIVRTAKELAKEQGARKKAGRPPLAGNLVVARLKAAGAPKRTEPKVTKLKPLKTSDGRVALSGTYSDRAGWTLKIPADPGISTKQLVAEIRKVLDSR